MPNPRADDRRDSIPVHRDVPVVYFPFDARPFSHEMALDDPITVAALDRLGDIEPSRQVPLSNGEYRTIQTTIWLTNYREMVMAGLLRRDASGRWTARIHWATSERAPANVVG